MIKLRNTKMTIDESLLTVNSYFDKKFNIIYYERTLPPFKYGKSKFSNKDKKQKISKLDNDIVTFDRELKLNNILDEDSSHIENYIGELKEEKRSMENNEIESYSSYGRYSKKIEYFELTDEKLHIEKIQNEFIKYGISIPIQTYPIYKVSINVSDFCKFANIIKNNPIK